MVALTVVCILFLSVVSYLTTAHTVLSFYALMRKQPESRWLHVCASV